MGTAIKSVTTNRGLPYFCGDYIDLRKPLNRNLHVSIYELSYAFHKRSVPKISPKYSVHDIYIEQNTDFLNFKVFTERKQIQTLTKKWFYGLRTHLKHFDITYYY